MTNLIGLRTSLIFFLQFFVDIMTLWSRSVDPHIFSDPEADPTDPNLWLLKRMIQINAIQKFRSLLVQEKQKKTPWKKDIILPTFDFFDLCYLTEARYYSIKFTKKLSLCHKLRYFKSQYLCDPMSQILSISNHKLY